MDDLALIDEIVRRAEEHQKQREKEFAISELENIKEEIEKCYYNDSSEVDGVIIFKEDVNNIFNKHVAELKGENNIEEKEESDVLSNS